MFNINVDLSGLGDALDEARIDAEMLQQGLANAAIYVRDVWTSAVQGNVLPGMSRAIYDDKYASALATGASLNFPTPFQAIIAPVGYTKEVQIIEAGRGPWDMKPDLLNGPKSRPTVDGAGRYNTIPFRHYTPKKAGGGASAIAIKMQMPDDVYKEARKLVRSVSDGNGGIKWEKPLNWDAPPATSFTGYTHKSSIYHGMYKTGAPGHTNYMTFRRVSTPRIVNGKTKGSDPLSWWHPAVAPNSIIQAVYDFCLPKVTENLLKLVERSR